MYCKYNRSPQEWLSASISVLGSSMGWMVANNSEKSLAAAERVKSREVLVRS